MSKGEYIDRLRGQVSEGIIFTPGERACNRGCINPQGDLLFVASEKQVVGYNLMTETCFKIFRGHDGQVEDLDVETPEGERLVSCGNSQHLIVHNIETGAIIVDKDEGKILRACCFGPPRMHFIATVSAKQLKQPIELKGYHLVDRNGIHQLVQKFKLTLDTPVNCIRWPHADLIIMGDDQGRILLVDVSGETPEIKGTFNAHRGPINNITMSFCGQFFATASADTTACTWRVPGTASEPLEKMGTYNHSFLVSCAAISPNAPHIVLASSADQSNVARTSFGSTDFTINFFHTIFQEEFASMKVHKSTVNWVGFTPDGRTLVTTSHEGTCQVIRLGGQYEKIVREHQKELETIAEQVE